MRDSGCVARWTTIALAVCAVFLDGRPVLGAVVSPATTQVTCTNPAFSFDLPRGWVARDTLYAFTHYMSVFYVIRNQALPYAIHDSVVVTGRGT